MATSAVKAVFSEGVADELPFQGDVDEAVRAMMPCMEDIFQMRELRPAPGTARWVQYMTQHLVECNFEDLAQNPALARYYWKNGVQKDTRGRPALKNSDVLVWKTYKSLKEKGNICERVCHLSMCFSPFHR